MSTWARASSWHSLSSPDSSDSMSRSNPQPVPREQGVRFPLRGSRVPGGQLHELPDHEGVFLFGQPFPGGAVLIAGHPDHWSGPVGRVGGGTGDTDGPGFAPVSVFGKGTYCFQVECKVSPHRRHSAYRSLLSFYLTSMAPPGVSCSFVLPLLGGFHGARILGTVNEVDAVSHDRLQVGVHCLCVRFLEFHHFIDGAEQFAQFPVGLHELRVCGMVERIAPCRAAPRPFSC